MADTWYSKDVPPGASSGFWGYIVGVLRALFLVPFVFGGLLLLLLIRLIEYPLCGAHRPVTPAITTFVCRNSLRVLGVGYEVKGQPLAEEGAIVANHSSWLDIFALNAATQLYFVSKAEVATWPGIGWLARATGTVFIERDRRQARAHIDVFKNRLAAGHKLLFFPEGTSTDGLQVLPFKPTLFAAFLDPEMDKDLPLQAVTVVYHAPKGQDPRFYGWWGNMDFGPHLWSTLAATRQGKIEVVFHEPVLASSFADRKVMAQALEDQVREALTVRT